MDTSLVVTIITSAAVGALASSVVSLIGQALERRARRRELLIQKAIELAQQRTELVMKAANAAGARAVISDSVVLAAEYFQLLDHILTKGDLPDAFKEKVERLSAERPRA